MRNWLNRAPQALTHTDNGPPAETSVGRACRSQEATAASWTAKRARSVNPCVAADSSISSVIAASSLRTPRASTALQGGDQVEDLDEHGLRATSSRLLGGPQPQAAAAGGGGGGGTAIIG